MGGHKMRDLRISRALFYLGLSPRHKGFHYISAAISGLLNGLNMGEALDRVREDAKDDPKQFDRCMRYAINYAWDVAGGGIRSLFPGFTVPPSPKEFIFAMQWELEDDALPQKGSTDGR